MAMCLSKGPIVLAIYGPSCVGKSTLARELGRQLGIEVRHCGEALKEHATELGVALDAIPITIHQSVDEETRRLARQASGTVVIEGRYLDLVLSDIPSVRFIRLTCDEATRNFRYSIRESKSIPPRTLQEEDEDDAQARALLYSGVTRSLGDWMSLNTTQHAPHELVATVLAQIHRKCDD
jgi:cytidylate kinase